MWFICVDGGVSGDVSGGDGDGSSGHGCGLGNDSGGTLKKGSPTCSVSRCGCGFERRGSNAGVLDEEGYAMLEILDFPSKVQQNIFAITIVMTLLLLKAVNNDHPLGYKK